MNICIKKNKYSKGHLTLNLMYRLIDIQLIAIEKKFETSRQKKKSQP